MLFRNGWKLTAAVRSTSGVVQDPVTLFAFMKRAGAELAPSQKPSDLKSLVRVLSSFGTFKYPAFQPAIRDLVERVEDPEWADRLIEEANICSNAKALDYLKVLTQMDIPQGLLEALLKKVKVSTPKELRDYISAVHALPSSGLTTEVRNTTTYAVKNAVINKMRLSTYLQIWHMIHHHWRAGRKHVIPTKLRSDLIQATWSSLPILDLTKESDFVDCVTWLAMAEQPSFSSNKDEIANVLDKLEMQARRSITKSLSPSSIITMLSHIINESRAEPFREPLESISQTILQQFSLLKNSQHQDNLSSHVELASSIDRFYTRHGGSSLQVEEIITSILPVIMDVLERNLSQIPSRSLPVVLRLISRAGGDVGEELARRGHELNGTELVRLINTCPLQNSRELILQLFETSLNDLSLLTDLVSSLRFEDKLEFLGSLIRHGLYHHDDLTVLTEGLLAGIKSDSSVTPPSHDLFSLDTLIKMSTCGDSQLFESLTGGCISPKNLLNEFLASDRPGKELGLDQAIELLSIQDSSDYASIRTAVVDFVFASRDSLSASQCVRLLSVFETQSFEKNEALKLIVPKIGQIDEINSLMMHVVGPLYTRRGPKYSPSNQLRQALGDRIGQLVGSMDSPALTNCLSHMARLDLVSSPSIINKMISRLNELVTIPSQFAGGRILQSLVSLRVFDKKILDSVVREYVRSSHMSSSEQVASVAAACTRLGYRNREITDLCENIMRQSDSMNLSVTISLLHSLAHNQIYSPLFQEKLKLVMEECSRDISAVPDSDWVKMYEINLALLVDSAPRIKSKYMNDKNFKSFVDDNCAYSWYAEQERARNRFIHSEVRGQVQAAIESLGWSMRVPEIGKEVYHVDFLTVQTNGASVGDNNDKVAIVMIPETDELRNLNSNDSSHVRVILGDSMVKIRHLQMFGYSVVPVWESEWVTASGNLDKQKDLLLKYSNQVVYATGVSPK